MTEKWGFKEWPEADTTEMRNPVEHFFKDGRFEGLNGYMEEVRAVTDPQSYAEISRPDREEAGGYADKVVIDYPGDRLEVYEVDPGLESVDIAVMDSEGHRSSHKTYTASWSEIGDWLQDIVLYDDGLTWRRD